MTAKEKIKKFTARIIQDNRRNWALHNFARLSRFYYYSWQHPTFELEENGEGALLRTLAAEGYQTVFDVGANVGDWSRSASELLKAKVYHAFEPVPDTYASMVKNLADLPQVTPHPYGLSDSDATVEFTYYGPENSVLSTMSNAIHTHLPSTQIPIQLRNGDGVMKELSIDRIDMLKIDVEGMEYEVLTGFREALKAGRIGVIQFEKQPGRRLLKDYFELLGSYGYRIGKIFSRYVDFRPYEWGQERTAGPNYIAISAGQEALIRRLQAGYNV